MKLYKYRFYENFEVSIGPFTVSLKFFTLHLQVVHISRFIALRSVWLFWHLLILHHSIDT